ncbi:hypothetical protein SAY87_003211 [Trapa incisa]|uniref:FIST C-domain domain-containing protein n=1 Tax=Trapa incisa TaxID=236973 RepID=A0AAN7KR18_9MYRT|nr:hypothetical protein SAY87_003211 [Trapa incisa]
MADSSPARTSKVSRYDRPDEMFFASCHEDILYNILRRLPAPSFASAACVCKTWHRISNQILSRPLMASALSLNPSPLDALLEVLEKVLSEPIRPHFAIVNVRSDHVLSIMLQHTAKRLGSTTLIIVSRSCGSIGRDASTGEVLEVQGGSDGVVLTVGFVPGLKVDAFPLRQPRQEPAMLDKLIMDIREFSASVSGQPVPVGIMIFGDGRYDLKQATEKLDYAMPMQTAIVGDEGGTFVYQTADKTRLLRSNSDHDYNDIAIALTFVRDSNNDHGFGEIKFHVALSEGILACGPIYKAASVRRINRATWLTAKREGSQEILDGERMLMDIDEEPGEIMDNCNLYIGVTKRRRYVIESSEAGFMESLSLHSIFRADEEYLYVEGHGIRTGDRFQFYSPDEALAFSTCDKVSASLERLNLGIPPTSVHQTVPTSASSSFQKEEVFGGYIFSCSARKYFSEPLQDTSPFIKNYPGMPLAGVFCAGEIGRRTNSLSDQNPDGAGSASLCSHVFSSIYLVMTYTPPAPWEAEG